MHIWVLEGSTCHALPASARSLFQVTCMCVRDSHCIRRNISFAALAPFNINLHPFRTTIHISLTYITQLFVLPNTFKQSEVSSEIRLRSELTYLEPCSHAAQLLQDMYPRFRNNFQTPDPHRHLEAKSIDICNTEHPFGQCKSDDPAVVRARGSLHFRASGMPNKT